MSELIKIDVENGSCHQARDEFFVTENRQQLADDFRVVNLQN